MASLLVSKAPQCTYCIRQMTYLANSLSSPTGQQVRGKKRLAKVQTVTVQLLQNVPGYGRKGQVLPVSPGVMRNIWYPKKMAGYVTLAKLQSLGKNEAVIERDPLFGSRKQRESLKKGRSSMNESEDDITFPVQAPVQEAAPIAHTPIEVEFLNPAESMEIISKLLPPNIDFYRTPIEVGAAPPTRLSPSIPAGSALSRAAEAAVAERTARATNPRTPERTSIYGSVSTSDIAASIKAILAEDDVGKSVVLSPENISFVKETENKDRVKHLGVFEIEIRLDNAPDSVRRTIKVNAQE